MDKNYLVTKANTLITANYDLSLQEQKLILTLASMVQPNDEEFKEYEFKIADFIKLLGIETQTKYTEVPKITKALMKKVFEIKEGKDIIQLAWLSSVRYKTGQGIVVLKFDSSLKSYMLELKELYTSYKLENILSLKSKYSLRIYELLKCNQFKKVWEIELEELKRILGIIENSYSIYQNVKNRIIIQSQKELKEKTDISFEFEEIKTGRKVTSLKFFIHQNKKKFIASKQKQVDDEVSVDIETPLDHLEERIGQTMTILNNTVTPSEALSICGSADGDMDLISKAYEYTKTKTTDNFVGYIIKVIQKMKAKQFNEPKKSSSTNGFNNFEPRQYDYDNLEKKLLGWED